MKLVIDIHERDFESLQNGNVTYGIIDAVRNGKPLDDVLDEPEDKPVNVVLDEMKSIVDRMIDDGLKMIEKRRERINENT